MRSTRKPRAAIQIQHALSGEQAATLRDLIADHARAQVAESWAGGGDPLDVPVVKVEALAAQARLEAFINRLEREGQ